MSSNYCFPHLPNDPSTRLVSVKAVPFPSFTWFHSQSTAVKTKTNLKIERLSQVEKPAGVLTE